ncbi:MAG: putative 4-hydroxybenzoate polyprenyltransferase [Deltaproteobacteria bacterium]|nr:putative 4-hydroxybenzoate polyprenyltransferase [Deltaproteobacteria bacterium]
MNIFGSFPALCRMIKIEHSVFALPFALGGACMAARGLPPWPVLFWLVVAMVGIRSFAMAFNRVADLRFDRLNPRTQKRPLVTGEIRLSQAWAFIVCNAALFVFACAMLNSLCLALAPLALFMSAAYSLLKRVTWLCHFGLGCVHALAPLAGWLSVDPRFAVTPFLFAWGVLFWLAGFDILYACQDADFDRGAGLHSIPADLGIPRALAVSSFCHVNTAIFFLTGGVSADLSFGWHLVWALITGILLWEHTLVKADDLSRVNLAFFTLNGFVALAFLPGVILGL